METSVLYELIGYTASLLVAISLMMSAIVKLRIVNMIGAFIFTIYGILIGSIPVAAMNGFIVLINIYYLVRIYQNTEYFQLLQTSDDNNYLNKFLEFYRESIKTYQPDFTPDKPYNFALFVLSDMVPAGLLLGNKSERNHLHISLDFVIPDYRDFQIGHFLFVENLNYFRENDIQTISALPGNSHHNNYLEKVGFEKQNGTYHLSVK